MLHEIYFATSNKGKVGTLQQLIHAAGLDITVVQHSLDLVEPQADTAAEIAHSKVRQAYDLLQKPVLVDDSSFHIYALGGFPGPYIKYAIETIGAGGIVGLMQDKADRRAYATSTLAYADHAGAIHEFTAQRNDGRIAETVRDGRAGWSDLWKVYMPAGFDKTLSEMTSDEHARREQQEPSAYNQFVEWLAGDIKTTP